MNAWFVIGRNCVLTAFLGLAAPFVVSLHAATATLIPDKDTSLFQTAPNNNVGGNRTLASGGTARNAPVRMLMRFNVAEAVPPEATITEARLTITVTMAPGAPRASTFALYPMLVDWGEGTGGANLSTGVGRLAQEGEASWNNRLHPSTGWGTAGTQAGVDYVDAISSTAEVNTGSSTFGSTDELVQDVQRWLDDPASNYGWIVISQAESTVRTARRFGSRENPTASVRPSLEIVYEQPPLLIAGSSRQGDRFQLSFPGEAGVTYQVQYAPELPFTNWFMLTNVGPLTSAETIIVQDSIEIPARFYRLMILPSL